MNRDKLIEEHMEYARKIAKRIKYTLPDFIPLDDLIGWAYLGLVDAANKYKFELGISFKTYSYYRIKGAIYDGLRKFSWVKPSHYSKYKFNEATNNLIEEISIKNRGLKNTPDIESIKDIVFQMASIHLISLDAGFKRYNLKTKEGEDPETNLIQNEVKVIVKDLLSNLTEEELTIIKLYYYRGLSMEEIGKKMNFSKAWVSRKHNKIISKLRKIWLSEKSRKRIKA